MQFNSTSADKWSYIASPFDTNLFISPQQHGFMKGRSVETSLSSFVSDLLQELNVGGHIYAIYADFTSAFDYTSHHMLQKSQDVKVYMAP